MRIIKILTCLLPVCLSATACGDMHYVDNQSLRSAGYLHAPDQSDIREHRYGAVILSDRPYTALVDSNTSDNQPPRIYVIKRQKQKMLAETLLSDQSGTKNAVFEKSYLSFSADKQKKRVGIELRFLF